MFQLENAITFRVSYHLSTSRAGARGRGRGRKEDILPTAGMCTNMPFLRNLSTSKKYALFTFYIR